MKHRIGVLSLLAVIALGTTGDLLACGDKFLVSGRGTRYQRPKNARAASVLIYADPSSALEAAVRKVPVESVLMREGHRSTTAERLEQVAALVAGGRFDVILAASSVAAAVEQLLGGGVDAPIVVALCAATKPEARKGSCVKAPVQERSLLEAVDKAVLRRDRNARRLQARS